MILGTAALAFGSAVYYFLTRNEAETTDNENGSKGENAKEGKNAKEGANSSNATSGAGNTSAFTSAANVSSTLDSSDSAYVAKAR